MKKDIGQERRATRQYVKIAIGRGVKNKMESYNEKGQQVGKTITNKYVTHRRKEHFMRKFLGFGISKRILDEQKALGCEEVVIFYAGKKEITYSCPIDLFINSEKKHTFEETDLQHFVAIKGMKVLL